LHAKKREAKCNLNTTEVSKMGMLYAGLNRQVYERQAAWRPILFLH